jgi:hypothetical protein
MNTRSRHKTTLAQPLEAEPEVSAITHLYAGVPVANLDASIVIGSCRRTATW